MNKVAFLCCVPILVVGSWRCVILDSEYRGSLISKAAIFLIFFLALCTLVGFFVLLLFVLFFPVKRKWKIFCRFDVCHFRQLKSQQAFVLFTVIGVFVP